MNKETLIERSVSDAITAKPIRFSVTYNKRPLHRLLSFLHQADAVKKFNIYPPTLGKMQILSKLYIELDFNEEALTEQPHTEAMRVCAERTDVVCRLMAVAVCKTERELLDDNKIDNLASFFKWNCSTEDFSSCLLAILTQIDYTNFMTSIRLTKMLRLNKPTTTERANRIEQ